MWPLAKINLIYLCLNEEINKTYLRDEFMDRGDFFVYLLNVYYNFKKIQEGGKKTSPPF